MHVPGGKYSEEHLSHVAFPLGGLGAGMLAIEGTGALSRFSLRGAADVFFEPVVFGAVASRSGAAFGARVLEGPVPAWKPMFPWGTAFRGAGNGAVHKTYGLPRFREATFEARFPFAAVSLADEALPFRVRLEAFSPFVPGDEDASSLPVAGLDYVLENLQDEPLALVVSFHAENFLEVPYAPLAPRRGRVEIWRGAGTGFVLRDPGAEDRPELAFAVVSDVEGAVDANWHRGDWFDALTTVWRHIESGELREASEVETGAPSPGGSLYIPVDLSPRGRARVRFRLAWYTPRTTLCVPGSTAHTKETSGYVPWYAGRFAGVEEVLEHFGEHETFLRGESRAFSEALFDTTLPAEVVEAVASNLSILKTPTFLRQADGRGWGWEGCFDHGGSCSGTCTHVWNYAQSLASLFPRLERGLRTTALEEGLSPEGILAVRMPLPLAEERGSRIGVADGQLGVIMQVHREWRHSGDEEWLAAVWPAVERSLAWSISCWDPGEVGVLSEPHHVTYDVEFHGAEPMGTFVYHGALAAAIAMGRSLGQSVRRYEDLLDRGRRRAREQLFDGEYFFQPPLAREDGAFDGSALPSTPRTNRSPEDVALERKEGPKYQYGAGCLTEAVIGEWMSQLAGIGNVVEEDLLRAHLEAVYRHNWKPSLHAHVNPQRSAFALGDEGGLVLCTWPKGGARSIPFPYASEVWTGVEYAMASLFVMTGQVERGLEVVRSVRRRYDGRRRDPFDEMECGHWYARAMSSYGLLYAFTGAWYDREDQVLYLDPQVEGDFRALFATDGGYGTVGVRAGIPFFEPRGGGLDISRIEFRPRYGRELLQGVNDVDAA